MHFCCLLIFILKLTFSEDSYKGTIRVSSNSSDPDQDQHIVRLDLDPNLLTRLSQTLLAGKELILSLLDKKKQSLAIKAFFYPTQFNNKQHVSSHGFTLTPSLIVATSVSAHNLLFSLNCTQIRIAKCWAQFGGSKLYSCMQRVKQIVQPITQISRNSITGVANA